MQEIPPLLSPEQFAQGTGGKILASDPRVQLLIDGATAAIRRYCRWHVAPVVDQSFRLDGPGGAVLVLPTMRIEEVESVAERGVALEDDVHYEWSANGEIRRLGRALWTYRWRAIDVKIRHGFESADDLAQIVQQVVANALASPMGATREQAGQVSVSWATTAPGVSGGLSLLERDMALLNTYRLPGGA